MTEQSRMDEAVTHAETADDPIEELARIVAADRTSLAQTPSGHAGTKPAVASQGLNPNNPAAPALDGSGLGDPDEFDLEAELIAELGGAAPAGSPDTPGTLDADYPSLLPASLRHAAPDQAPSQAAPEPETERSLEEMLLAELEGEAPPPAATQFQQDMSAASAAEQAAGFVPDETHGLEADAANAELASSLFPDTGFNEPGLPPETLSGQTATLDVPVAEAGGAATDAAAQLEAGLDEGFAEMFAEELQALDEAVDEPPADLAQAEVAFDPPQYDQPADSFHHQAEEFPETHDPLAQQAVEVHEFEPQDDLGFDPGEPIADAPLEEWEAPVSPQTHESFDGPTGFDDASQSAGSPASDLDLDFGAAFDMQVQNMQVDAPAGQPTDAHAAAYDPAQAGYRHDEAPAGNYGNEDYSAADHVADAQNTGGVRDLENQFAAAFADELDFAGTPQPGYDQPAATEPPPFTPPGGGWHDGDTGRAADDFGAQAASTSAVPGLELDHGQYGDEFHTSGIDEGGHHDVAGTAMAAETGNERGFNKGFRFAAGALGIALVVGAAAVGYSFVSGSGGDVQPVVVKADNDPVKVKPEDPGGTTIANQDRASYQRVAGQSADQTGQERLVSDTEQPVDVAALRQQAPNAAAGEAEAPKAEARLTPQSSTPQLLNNGQLQPRRVRTLAVNPDGSVVASAQPSVTASPAADARSAAIENRIGGASGLTGQRAATEVATGAEPASIDGARSTGELAVPSPRPRDTASAQPVAAPSQPQAAQAPIALAPANQPAQPASTTGAQVSAEQIVQSLTRNNQGTTTQTAAVPAPVAAGAWAVQLSSQRSAEEAQTSFQQLRARHPSILDNRQMSVQRAEIEGRGIFFRLRVLADTRNEAINLCERLKAAGESCFVTQ